MNHNARYDKKKQQYCKCNTPTTIYHWIESFSFRCEILVLNFLSSFFSSLISNVAFPIVHIQFQMHRCVSYTWLFVIVANYILIIGAISGSHTILSLSLCICVHSFVHHLQRYAFVQHILSMIFFFVLHHLFFFFCSVHETFVSMCQNVNDVRSDFLREF